MGAARLAQRRDDALAEDADGVLRETNGFRAGTVRGTIAPLGAFDALNARPFDAGLGYMAELDAESDATFRTHGPHLSATYFPLVQELGGSARSNPPWGKQGPNENPLLRLGLSASGELLLSDDGGELDIGGGTTASVILDLTIFAHGPAVSTATENGFFIGGVHGETGIGVFVSGSYRGLHGADYGVVGGGLTVVAGPEEDGHVARSDRVVAAVEDDLVHADPPGDAPVRPRQADRCPVARGARHAVGIAQRHEGERGQ